MTRLLATLLVLGALLGGAHAQQTFTPQSGSGLSVTFTTERIGGSRVMFFGEVRNATNAPAERVTLLAEGLDEAGKVISRGRSYVHGLVPARGTSSFEIRLSAAGSEKRYRVQVESFQFLNTGN